MPEVLNTIRVLSRNGPVTIELARWEGRLVVAKRVVGASEMMASRLGREAQVAGRLRHVNIVPLLGVVDGALIYDYCPGINLAELIDETRLQPARIVEIMDGVLSALSFAHAQGVIHLDVKPSNILIRGREAFLTDFGFAKDLALANITSEHALMGTPGYMAPEQFRGIRNDPRSDVYGVAAVLHHMLTGQPPYGSDVLRFLLGDAEITLKEPDGPAAPFADLLRKALQRDPDERFQTVDELRAALNARAPRAGMTA